jgi:aquaporin Z
VNRTGIFHWQEYLIEAFGLGTFMVSAGLFGTILWSPHFPGSALIGDAVLTRAAMGMAMGITAILLIYSPWGQRSGAHLNPAVTLAFFRLGKVRLLDAVLYVLAQFVGGFVGVFAAQAMLGGYFLDPPVSGVVTVPGEGGVVIAFIAEAAISFFLMEMILVTSNTSSLSRYTGVFAGLLLFLFITFESPLSGMSINPARSFGSAAVADIWTAFWIYLIAPPVGMLAASELYLRKTGLGAVFCAKLHHGNHKRCIFNCGYRSAPSTNTIAH